MIYLARVDQVDVIWPHIREGMERACKKGGGSVTPYWLWTICRRSEALLFYVLQDDKIQAALIVEEQQLHDKKVLHVHAACGMGMKQWLKEANTFARSFGLPLRFEGRPGLGKVVDGAKVVRHVYEVNEVEPIDAR